MENPSIFVKQILLGTILAFLLGGCALYDQFLGGEEEEEAPEQIMSEGLEKQNKGNYEAATEAVQRSLDKNASTNLREESESPTLVHSISEQGYLGLQVIDRWLARREADRQWELRRYESGIDYVEPEETDRKAGSLSAVTIDGDMTITRGGSPQDMGSTETNAQENP